jgi:hypothetical protein
VFLLKKIIGVEAASVAGVVADPGGERQVPGETPFSASHRAGGGRHPHGQRSLDRDAAHQQGAFQILVLQGRPGFEAPYLLVGRCRERE